MSESICSVWLGVATMVACLSSCAEDGAPPMTLPEGGWGGPARLANCYEAEMCELDRWASRSAFEVIVLSADAEVSSSDPSVLEILSAEERTEIEEPFFCWWDCTPRTVTFLGVLARTHDSGRAELVIDGPAGDQARLPVNVVDVERFQIVDVVSGEILQTIDENMFFVRLEAYDSENSRLAAQGRWAVETPDALNLSVAPLDEVSGSLEYSATAFLFATTPVTTTLQIEVGETLIEIPVEVNTGRS